MKAGMIRKPSGRVPKDTHGVPMDWDYVKGEWIEADLTSAPGYSNLAAQESLPTKAETTTKPVPAGKHRAWKPPGLEVSAPSPAQIGTKASPLTPRTPAEQKELQEVIPSPRISSRFRFRFQVQHLPFLMSTSRIHLCFPCRRQIWRWLSVYRRPSQDEAIMVAARRHRCTRRWNH